MGVTEKRACDSVNFLISSRYLGQGSDIKRRRYSRHELYYSAWSPEPSNVQEKLSGSSVAILGCGGIGNHVSSQLAAAGVGHLVLIDDDVIEISNLTRQTMFVEADVGKNKVDILAERLSALNSEIVVGTILTRIKESRSVLCIPDVDVVVISADEPADLVAWCNDDLCQRKIPFINAGYVGDIAVVGPFVIPGETACFACTQVIPDQVASTQELSSLAARMNAGYQAPSFGPVNGMAASMAALEVIRYLGKSVPPHSKNRRIGIHSASVKIEFQNFQRNLGCTVCASI